MLTFTHKLRTGIYLTSFYTIVYLAAMNQVQLGTVVIFCLLYIVLQVYRCYASNQKYMLTLTCLIICMVPVLIPLYVQTPASLARNLRWENYVSPAHSCDQA
jgi:hypothetical protein